MPGREPTMLGTVMKHIACTPNRNPDAAAYEKGVIEPARRIRQMQESLGDKEPDAAQAREAVELLLKIFATKEVDWPEREERIRDLLDRHSLHSLFPDLLPLRPGPG